jgi:hypothetical protein
LATYLVLILAAPSPARAQNPDWGNIEILPESDDWNYPGRFRLRALADATVSWEIKCTKGDCEGREAEFVYNYEFNEGDIIFVGWGFQCYRWQFDPIDWPHGYIAEPEPECFEDTPTPTITGTIVTTPPGTPGIGTDTPTPTSTGTIITTPPATPGIGTDTPTPTSTGTIITTPPATTDTATPTVTGTIITTPPATPGIGTPDTDVSPTPTPEGSPTPVPPAQPPAETPRSQIIAVTGADLSASSGLLPRITLSLGIVLLGLGLVKLGTSRKSKRD